MTFTISNFNILLDLALKNFVISNYFTPYDLFRSLKIFLKIKVHVCSIGMSSNCFKDGYIYNSYSYWVIAYYRIP